KPGKSDFKWGEWKLNAGAVQKVQLPDLKLTGGVDTLRYKLSRSKGCYVDGKLLLRPQTVPELKLKDEALYCLPDTIFDFRKESFVEKITLHHLIVYKDKLSPSMLRYEDYSTGPAPVKFPLNDMNGKMFIYEIKNTLVDSALMSKCRIVDTVLLKVSTPKLKVKGNDELRYPWEKYEFASVQTKKLVDTAQLVSSSLQWRLIPEGTDCGTGLYGGEYKLTDADRTEKDTLKFEVSARSLCGDELKDTLYVELIHLKIQGYKDTICSNEEGYPLWEKVRSSHVDPASVHWAIVYPDPSLLPSSVCGELTAETGTGVKYKPGTADSVRIWFEAALEGVPAETLDTVVVLKINPAPVLEFSQDTLWACNKQILLKDIDSYNLHSAYVTRIVPG
ncbi:MAG: hypothetical protein K2I90_04155, partial [Odoribacter sp.]|nr:hypothetical protein [Odoribacter sp.]